MAVLTINQYIDAINSFVDNVKSSKNAYYLFYGKTDAWTNPTTGQPDDTTVPAANTSVYSYEQSIYNDLIFGKLITPYDVSKMINRYDWVSGNVYASYNQYDENIYEKLFYVVTDAFEVYKCIFNNNGEPSTVKPAVTSPIGVFKTGDGYVWKYMYTIASNANSKFTSARYIPVTPNPDVANNAIPGSIDHITIVTGGNNYHAYDSGTLQNFTNTTVVQLANTASSESEKYTGSAIYLIAGDNSGQLRKIINYKGPSKLLTVDEPFNTSVVLNLTDIVGNTIPGYLVTQRTDKISLLYQQGFFNSLDTITQTDTGANGYILTANATQIKLIKTDEGANDYIIGYPIYNTSQSPVIKSGTGNVTTNSVTYGIVTFSGSGYISNAVITTTSNDTTGINALANAHNSDGKLGIPPGRIDDIKIENWGSNYSKPPTFTIDPPTKINFNACTAVDDNNDFINIGANGIYFSNDDFITYSVDTGVTPLTQIINGVTYPLANNSNYYAAFANSTGLKLAVFPGSNSTVNSVINIVKGESVSGHYIQGQQATANSFIDAIYINTTSGAINFKVGDYIKIGDADGVNIRRIIAVNNSVIEVFHGTPFANSIVSNTLYLIPSAIEPQSIVITQANGLVSNTNLNSLTIKYSNNVSIPSKSYTIGERVDMIGADGYTQGANGIVSYCNSNDFIVILSYVNGQFVSGTDRFIKGASSLQIASIERTDSFPNITLSNPEGSFISGQNIFIKTTPDLTIVGHANLISAVKMPNETTNYVISPAVDIFGDGDGAKAYSVVNTNFNSANDITDIVVINNGTGYTYANINISVNPSLPTYGNGATANVIISPVAGHGAFPYKELGARYAGVSMVIDTGLNESFKFPVQGNFRKIGIIENPLFDDLMLTLDTFDTVNLKLLNTTGNFNTGEYCFQSGNSSITGMHAAGIVVSSNSTFMQLKNIFGTFSNVTACNVITGLSSGSTSDVMLSNTVYFTISSNVELISEIKSNAIATISEVFANTAKIRLKDVSGRFDINDTLFDATTNASANVTGMYISNGTIDASTNFGLKFSQIVRLSLSSNTSAFVVGETITQDVTLASGVLFDHTSDLDLYYGGTVTGNFNVGDTIYYGELNSSTLGICTYVYYNYATGQGYIRLTNVVGNFTAGNKINSVSGGADLLTIQSVLLLKNIKTPVGKFQTGNYQIKGDTSKSYGKNQNPETNFNTILYPDLVRNSGQVVYLENVSPVIRSPTSKEQINLVIKF